VSLLGDRLDLRMIVGAARASSCEPEMRRVSLSPSSFAAAFSRLAQTGFSDGLWRMGSRYRPTSSFGGD
jgi:hypothetical protein